jgi:hypothetical protein
MKKLMLLVLAVLLAATVWATTLVCNIDKMTLVFTGKTKAEYGVLLFEHKCLNNHRFWLTSEQMNQ